MPNVAPPANWQQPGFDDSTWPLAAVIVAHPGGDPNDEIWAENPQKSDTEQALFRQHFQMPAVTVLSSQVVVGSDGQVLAIYVSGQLLSTSVPLPNAPQTEVVGTIPPAILHAPGDNVLAIWAQANGHIAAVPVLAWTVSYTD